MFEIWDEPKYGCAYNRDFETLAKIRNPLVSSYPGAKFLRTELLVIDLTNKNDHLEAAATKHSHAYRCWQDKSKICSTIFQHKKIHKTLERFSTGLALLLSEYYVRTLTRHIKAVQTKETNEISRPSVNRNAWGEHFLN